MRAPAKAENRRASLLPALLANHDDDEAPQGEDRGHAAGADEIHRRAAVLPGGRIVVKAEQQDLLRQPADLSLRGLGQGEVEVARLVLESKQVARQASVSCSDHQYSAVRELV